MHPRSRENWNMNSNRVASNAQRIIRKNGSLACIDCTRARNVLRTYALTRANDG